MPETLITNEKYQQRFGPNSQMPSIDEKMMYNGLIDRQLSRKTCRNFTDVAIDPEIIELMIAGAQGSATSGMLQTYSVLALTTKEDKDKLFVHQPNIDVIGGTDSHNMRIYYECPVFLIWLADLSKIKALMNEALTNNLLHDPACVNQLDIAEYNVKAIVDTTIVAQSFVMIAESYGYGTMYMGAIRQINPEHVQKQYNIPYRCMPIFGMAIGIPDTSKTAWGIIKPRMPTSSILHFGQYTPIQGIADLGDYNQWHANAIAQAGYHEENFTFVQRLVERFRITISKNRVGDFFKLMGFKFK